MNYPRFANIASLLLSAYFIVSGLTALLNIDAKLERIGLSAANPDGEVAFILIYCSLMVGIGIAMVVMTWTFRSAGPSLVLASTILFGFVIFRLIGSAMLGELGQTQVNYILIELLELSVVLFLLVKSGTFKQRYVTI